MFLSTFCFFRACSQTNGIFLKALHKCRIPAENKWLILTLCRYYKAVVVLFFFPSVFSQWKNCPPATPQQRGVYCWHIFNLQTDTVRGTVKTLHLPWNSSITSFFLDLFSFEIFNQLRCFGGALSISVPPGLTADFSQDNTDTVELQKGHAATWVTTLSSIIHCICSPLRVFCI